MRTEAGMQTCVPGIFEEDKAFGQKDEIADDLESASSTLSKRSNTAMPINRIYRLALSLIAAAVFIVGAYAYVHVLSIYGTNSANARLKVSSPIPTRNSIKEDDRIQNLVVAQYGERL